jgi:hypothetical protein
MDLEVLHSLCHEQESSLRHLQRNRRSQGRKTCFTCRKAERGQAQPQLYGTSYFFVSFALIGQMRQLEASIDRQVELTTIAQGIESFCQRAQQGLAQAPFEQKRHLVELLIDRVIVTQEQVEIRYVIPTSPRGETSRFY